MASATTASQALHSVFVYGSLLSDKVVNTLLGRLPRSFPAILHGFHRFSIKGRVYPAILPVENKQVKGKILLDITDRELGILDDFEAEEYERKLVEVSLIDNGSEKINAYTYVWENKEDTQLHGDWDFEEWKQTHLSDYLTLVETWVRANL